MSMAGYPPPSGGGGGGGGGDPAPGSGRGRHRILPSWMTSRDAPSSEGGAPPPGGLRHPHRGVAGGGGANDGGGRHWDRHPAGAPRQAEAGWGGGGGAERDRRGVPPEARGGGGGEGSYAYGGYEYDYDYSADQFWRTQQQQRQLGGGPDAWGGGQDAGGGADPYGGYYYQQQHHHHPQQQELAQHQQPYGPTAGGVVATAGGRSVAMPGPPLPPPLPPSPPPGGEEHAGVAQYGSSYDPTYDASFVQYQGQSEASQRWDGRHPSEVSTPRRPPGDGVRWDSNGKYQDWEAELAARKQQHPQRQQQQQPQQSQRRQRQSHKSHVDEAPLAGVPDRRPDRAPPPRGEAEGGGGRRPDWTAPPRPDDRQQGQGHDRRADDSHERKGAVLWKEGGKYQDWLSLLRAKSEGASASNPIDLRGKEGSGDKPAAAARRPQEERSPVDLTAEEPRPPQRSASAPLPHTKPAASGKKKKKQKGGVQYEGAISALADLSRRWSGPSVVVEEVKATKKKVDARVEKRKREKQRKKEKKLKKKMMEAAAKAVLYGGKVVGGDDEEMDISDESASDNDDDNSSKGGPKGGLRNVKVGPDKSARGPAAAAADGDRRKQEEKEEGEEEEGEVSEGGPVRAEDAGAAPPRQEDKEASARQEAEEQDEIEAIMAAAAAAAAQVSSLPTPVIAAEAPLAPRDDPSGVVVAATAASEAPPADTKARRELELRRAALERAKARLKAAVKKKRELAEKAASSAASAGPRDANDAAPGPTEPGPAAEPSEAREAPLSALQSPNLMIQNIGTVGPDDRVRIMPEGYWISEDDEVDEARGTAEGPNDDAAERETSQDDRTTEQLAPPGGESRGPTQTSEAAVPRLEGDSMDSAAALPPSPPPLPAPSHLSRKSSAQLKLELLKRKLALKQKERELMEKKKLLMAAAAAEGAGEGPPAGTSGPPALPSSAGEPIPPSDRALGVGEGQSDERRGHREAGPPEEVTKSLVEYAAADGVATGTSFLDPPSLSIARGSPQADREIAAATVESNEGEREGRQPVGLKLTTPVRSASAEVALTVPAHEESTRKSDERQTAAPVNIETLRKRQRELKHKNEITNLTNMIEKQRKLLSVQGTKLADCKATLERCAESIAAEEEALRRAEGHLEELVRRKRIMEGMVLAATRKLVGARKRLAEANLRNAKRKKRKKNQPTSKGSTTGGRALLEVNKSDAPVGVSPSLGPVGRSSQLRKRKATVAKASDFF